MNACLTLTLIYDDKPPIYKPGAQHTLKVSMAALKLLRACEREITKKTPKIRWDVNVYSLADRAVMEFSAFDDLARPVGARAQQGLDLLFSENQVKL